MSNPNFLTDEYGVPKPLAMELMEWANVQDVHVPTRFVGGPFEENERRYQRARKMMERVRELGYVRTERTA